MSVEEVYSIHGKSVVAGSIEGRGVVSDACYSTRKYGVHSVMPIARAKPICQRANFFCGSHRLYSEYSAKVFEILRRYSPLVEPMLLNEAFFDLMGC